MMILRAVLPLLESLVSGDKDLANTPALIAPDIMFASHS